MATKQKLYWDSCVFIAWLNDEVKEHGQAVIDGIAEMTVAIDADHVVLVTSVQTKTDVYDYKLKTQWARDEFSRMLQRPNIMLVNQDERVADRSREIRDYYAAKRGITLDATDCIQLASAIIYKADVFYTLDGNAHKPKPNALLKLDQPIAGRYALTLAKPHSQQGSLFSGVPKPSVSSAVKPTFKIVRSPASHARRKY